jgi:hypothetical protein
MAQEIVLFRTPTPRSNPRSRTPGNTSTHRATIKVSRLFVDGGPD